MSGLYIISDLLSIGSAFEFSWACSIEGLDKEVRSLKALGRHLIVELYGVGFDILNDIKKIEEVLTEAVTISGATMIKPFFHQFSPQGVSGVIVIAESHFSIHTWPEYGYAALDLFTCGDQIRFDRTVKFIKDSFKAESMQVMEIGRGIIDVPPMNSVTTNDRERRSLRCITSVNVT